MNTFVEAVERAIAEDTAQVAYRTRVAWGFTVASGPLAVVKAELASARFAEAQLVCARKLLEK